jgi:hypothetical protein
VDGILCNADRSRSFSTSLSKLGLSVLSQPEETKPDHILQCPVCLARPELLPVAKQFRYSRMDALRTHFRTHKLLMFFDNPGRQCDIPGWDHVFPSLNGYKLHPSKPHSIHLWWVNTLLRKRNDERNYQSKMTRIICYVEEIEYKTDSALCKLWLVGPER